MIDLFPKVISRPIPFLQCSTSDVATLGGDDLTRWKCIPQGGNFEYLPLNLRTSAKFSNAYRKLSLNEPSYTLPKTDGNLTTGAFFHPTQPRRINRLEKSRIGGYPEGFTFAGEEKEIAAIIGNSVPPLFMRAIATQISYKLWKGKPLTRYPKTMTYPEILDAAWQDHLKPKEPDAPTVISTFAGGGGSSLGYSMAGYRELLAVEWDNNAVETFKLNFPDVSVYHGDIAKLSVEECIRLAGLSEPGELDLLDGSPPCQGFSSAGKRILNDPRNQLFREYVRLLRGLKPKVFVMENVPGMVKGKMKLVFAEVMRELKASGYQVRCKKLNAMYFYVPQSRERLIFIGLRNDIATEVSYPKVESKPICVSEALQGVETKNTLTSEQNKWWKKLKPGQSGSEIHPNGHWFNFLKLFPYQIAPTVPKESGNAKFCYWDKPFGLSIDSYKRLGSFPEGFQFTGGYGKEKNRIGNSVPPLLIRAIANHIRKNIFNR